MLAKIKWVFFWRTRFVTNDLIFVLVSGIPRAAHRRRGSPAADRGAPPDADEDAAWPGAEAARAAGPPPGPLQRLPALHALPRRRPQRRRRRCASRAHATDAPRPGGQVARGQVPGGGLCVAAPPHALVDAYARLLATPLHRRLLNSRKRPSPRNRNLISSCQTLAHVSKTTSREALLVLPRREACPSFRVSDDFKTIFLEILHILGLGHLCWTLRQCLDFIQKRCREIYASIVRDAGSCPTRKLSDTEVVRQNPT